MDHVAIMKKSWGLIPKVLDRSKKIESRWSINRISPYDKVKTGDRVFFKNAGEFITAVAKVGRVEQFSNLDPSKVYALIKKYGGVDGINVASSDQTYQWAKNKRYCVLIYLKDSQKVKPFKINKASFGSAAAWLVVGNIQNVKI